MREIKIGDIVYVPEPIHGSGGDDWKFSFRGTVTSLYVHEFLDPDNGGTQFADVEDPAGDVFGVELSRLTLVEDVDDEEEETGSFLSEDNGATLHCDSCGAQVRSNEIHRCPPDGVMRRYQIMVEVLYDPVVTNVHQLDLAAIAYQIEYGACYGRINYISDEGLNRQQASALLELQGAGSDFLWDDDDDE